MSGALDNLPQDQTASSSSGETPAAQTLRCSLTGEVISAEEAYWAPPLITMNQLVSTIVSSATRNPGGLKHLLFDEQPDVPYSPRARDELAARRTAEQLKLLGLLLLILVVIVGIVWLLAGAFA